MTPDAVTVIVVNWNGGTLLDDCLGHLKQQSLPPARILVMDNGSTDSSAERARHVPGVTVRILGTNLGFAAANNRALDECDTDLVALLNPDAFPDADWLMRLVSAARANPDVAVFGSRQMMHGMSATLDGIGDVYHISGLVWRDGHCRAQSAADDIASAGFFSMCLRSTLSPRSFIKNRRVR